MLPSSKIYVAGHNGLVGSALVRALRIQGYDNIILRTRSQLDLRRQSEVEHFLAQEQPEYIFLAAARVGGILANSTYPADFLYDNAMITLNMLHAARNHGVRKVLFLGSSCIYPRNCAQPIREEALLTGPLEPTNEWYALAKIMGLKLCQAFSKQYSATDNNLQCIAAMPTNIYGINDTFNEQVSHVIPALIMKFHKAKIANKEQVTLWGTGTPLREFLYVDDVAEALVTLMKHRTQADWINIGSGQEYSIGALAHMIAQEVGFTGTLCFDPKYPDGTPRKLLDISRMTEYGWQPKTSLHEGLKKTVAWYLEHQERSKEE
jgi:GDP-L-fucose synthase